MKRDDIFALGNTDWQRVWTNDRYEWLSDCCRMIVWRESAMQASGEAASYYVGTVDGRPVGRSESLLSAMLAARATLSRIEWSEAA